MNTTLRLSFGNPLDTMRTRLKFQLRIDIMPLNGGNELFVTAVLARTFCEHRHLPALALGIAAVHAEQITRENSRFVAARASPDFQEDTACITRIFWQQQQLE